MAYAHIDTGRLGRSRSLHRRTGTHPCLDPELCRSMHHAYQARPDPQREELADGCRVPGMGSWGRCPPRAATPRRFSLPTTARRRNACAMQSGAILERLLSLRGPRLAHRRRALLSRGSLWAGIPGLFRGSCWPGWRLQREVACKRRGKVLGELDAPKPAHRCSSPCCSLRPRAVGCGLPELQQYRLQLRTEL